MRITQMFLNKISQRRSFTARIIYLHRRIIGNKDSKSGMKDFNRSI